MVEEAAAASPCSIRFDGCYDCTPHPAVCKALAIYLFFRMVLSYGTGFVIAMSHRCTATETTRSGTSGSLTFHKFLPSDSTNIHSCIFCAQT